MKYKYADICDVLVLVLERVAKRHPLGMTTDAACLVIPKGCLLATPKAYDEISGKVPPRAAHMHEEARGVSADQKGEMKEGHFSPHLPHSGLARPTAHVRVLYCVLSSPG